MSAAAAAPSRRACLFGATATIAGASSCHPAPASAAGADAELLALCADWQANEAEYLRLFRLDLASEEEAARQGRKVWDRDRIDFSAVVADGHDLLEEITAMPARTAAGRRAKAAVLAARVAPGGEDPSSYSHDECLALSLARDVLALAEGAS